MGHHLHSKVRIPSKGALWTKASYSKIQWLWVTILQSELGRGIVSASAELMFGRGPPLSSVLTGTLAGMRDNLPHTTRLIYYLSLKNVAVKKKLCHFNWWPPCQKILRLLEQGGLEFKHSFLTHFALIRLIQKFFLKVWRTLILMEPAQSKLMHSKLTKRCYSFLVELGAKWQ